ncbi:hypothetical protein NDU88_004822 [Pleurodeles waltl]|uniref:Uncharacterized protein n=1 Tax=Pleurodeles waltl TaxID=8319 RepID=A0AAV7LMF8_PLEWA|nr:hypothetical protein NDU88_004822 [Pleurodeles waltl]
MDVEVHIEEGLLPRGNHKETEPTEAQSPLQSDKIFAYLGHRKLEELPRSMQGTNHDEADFSIISNLPSQMAAKFLVTKGESQDDGPFGTATNPMQLNVKGQEDDAVDEDHSRYNQQEQGRRLSHEEEQSHWRYGSPRHDRNYNE